MYDIGEYILCEFQGMRIERTDQVISKFSDPSCKSWRWTSLS